MKIRKLNEGEKPPMDLLLLADPSPTFIEEYVHRGECYVVEMHGKTVGVYVLLATSPKTVEIVNIAVSQVYQGKGIGKRLVLDAIQQAKSIGFNTIEIGTGNSSIDQLALYQKCGFRIIGIEIDYFNRNYAEEIMENGIKCRDMIRLSQDL